MTGDEMLAELQSGHPRFEWVAQQIQENPSGLDKTCAAVYGDTDTIQVCVYAWKTHEGKTLFDARVYLKGASSNENVSKGIGLFLRSDCPQSVVTSALFQAADLLKTWHGDCLECIKEQA